MLQRSFHRIKTLLVVALLASSATALPAQQPNQMRRILDGRMLPDAEVHAFERSDLLYPSAVVARGQKVTPLAAAPHQLTDIHFRTGDKIYDLADYLAVNRVAGIVVLKNGAIAFEDHELGFTPNDRWASFSIAKSITSTLIGIAIKRGLIHSLDDPIVRYVPSLVGSAYADVSLRDVMHMASGVKWNEEYTDPASDCRKLLDAQMSGRPGASVAYMQTLRKAAAPGSVWNYNSGETNLVGAVLQNATGKSLAAYLSQTLWAPLGMESNATWWLESKGGMGLGGVGIGATLRDYARFGQFVADGGVLHGKSLVPDGWFNETAGTQFIPGHHPPYANLWWPVDSADPIQAGAFQALGIFGQHLYVNPKQHLVIVVLSARSKPTGSFALDDLAFFTAVAHSLQ
jgi:CubicO group peptidase (beta-lactamase class C family)